MSITLDKTRVARAFARNESTYDAEATVQRSMARDLVQALRLHCPASLSGVFEVGCGTGLVTRELLAAIALSDYAVNDLVAAHAEAVAALLLRRGVAGVSVRAGDVELLPAYPTERSLVVSGATLQWVSDIEAVIERLLNCLAPGGLLAFTSFGPENCREIRALTGVGLHYPTLDRLQEMVSRGADVLEARESLEQRYFARGVDVLRHLQRTGVNGAGRARWSPRDLRDFADAYRNWFGDAGGLPLTYHPLLLVARKD